MHTRDEWSAVIIRAATAVEIAANYAFRSESESQNNLDSKFVDSPLRWSNGLAGNLDKLLTPPTATDKQKHKVIKAPSKSATEINKKRNSIAHQGEFSSKQEAMEVIQTTHEFITALVQLYDKDFAPKRRKI